MKILSLIILIVSFSSFLSRADEDGLGVFGPNGLVYILAKSTENPHQIVFKRCEDYVEIQSVDECVASETIPYNGYALIDALKSKEVREYKSNSLELEGLKIQEEALFVETEEIKELKNKLNFSKKFQQNEVEKWQSKINDYESIRDLKKAQIKVKISLLITEIEKLQEEFSRFKRIVRQILNGGFVTTAEHGDETTVKEYANYLNKLDFYNKRKLLEIDYIEVLKNLFSPTGKGYGFYSYGKCMIEFDSIKALGEKKIVAKMTIGEHADSKEAKYYHFRGSDLRDSHKAYVSKVKSLVKKSLRFFSGKISDLMCDK